VLQIFFGQRFPWKAKGLLAVTIIDIGKLLSSTVNLVGAAFFKREFSFLCTEDNGKVEATKDLIQDF